ncbi:unnamed protein product [Prorocentrum cordatum]|uniref:Uncharacterized protein n=1 Tax=Prorocentrum cordatum TaxID=2364126 RepID=A0ABN9TRJ3_9DINO|nr:unnamed protein product [Polarella glacialis]
MPQEQRGATATLLKAPGHLRCGVSGCLLVEQATQVPASGATAYPVLFARQSLEKWHRRTGGRCPLTGQPLDPARGAGRPACPSGGPEPPVARRPRLLLRVSPRVAAGRPTAPATRGARPQVCQSAHRFGLGPRRVPELSEN